MPKEATEGTRTRRAAGTVKRKKKDPNAPKKALSAYMIFASENRQNVISENPGIAFGQIGKLLGERWRAMSDDQKSPYEVKAKEDKIRYTQEMETYQQAQH